MKGRIAGAVLWGKSLMWHSTASAADKEIGIVAHVHTGGPVRAVAF